MSGRSRFAWGLLGALLLALVVGAVTMNRARWPGLVGDEATYAMQAASLAYDFDLAYERADYDRFQRHWGRSPDGLILQSRDHGAHITFGKPWVYALTIAPFVRFAPENGAFVGNALLLALAALAAAWTLERRLGRWAPVWVAAFVFGSVTFVPVFWVHADVFLLAVVALAYALAWAGEGDPAERSARLTEMYEGDPLGAPEPRRLGRWLAIGALLGAAVTFRPFHLALAVPVWFAVGGGAPRHWRRGALVAGLVLVVGVSALGGILAGGSWTGYGGERQGFYGSTGFPDVDFDRANWAQSVARWGNTSWIHEETLKFQFDARLWAWNSVYFLIGQNVGVLPYFLPLLLGLFAARREGGRGWLPVAAVTVVAALFLVMPFNFYGGTGSVANRYFLPIYPAFWFLAARPIGGPRRSWLPPVLVTLAAAPFLWPAWLSAREFPVDDHGRYRHVGALAVRVLPYETTQSHIPGGRDVLHHNLWLKFRSLDLGPDGDDAAWLRLQRGGRGELLVGHSRLLSGVRLEVGAEGPSQVEVVGGTVGTRVLTPTGGVVFEIQLEEPFRIHPMWWTWEDYPLYRLEIAFPSVTSTAGTRFRLTPIVAGGPT
ncbi:MAG: hypothetical protein SF066_17295 [Thermoanaerobaculia bacterium]|nr:hypothetical protein [Thermoanaerobaculia bacterium]